MSVLALIGLISSCALRDTEFYVERPVEDLYSRALVFLERGRYQDAAKAFDEVERQHPYSVWATRAQLMGAYAYYEGNRYDESIIALDRFIQLHPGYQDIAYAYYLKALCYYEQIVDISRDQRMTELAATALQEVITRFPSARYAGNARLKLDLTVDHLAGKEMAVGRFYMQQKQYLSAINRFSKVVTDYQKTAYVPEALHRLVECYTILGLIEESCRATAILGHNFPGSLWYRDSYRLVSAFPIPISESGSWQAVCAHSFKNGLN